MPPIIEKKEALSIVQASRHFAREHPQQTWFEVMPTVILALIVQACLLLPVDWYWKLPLSLLFALLLLRLFTFFHDVQHGALFRFSRAGRWLINLFCIYFVYSPSVWRARHNDHHARNSMVDAREVGGQIPMLTVACWRSLLPYQQALYRRFRHPVTVLCGYLFYFVLPTAQSVRQKPLNHWDGILCLVAQPISVFALAAVFGISTAFMGFALPVLVAAALGSYLFYAQHSFEGVRYQRREQWDYYFAAFHTTSMFDMPGWLHWFTGNIGYHHVHHINARIPFYRLPAAMATIPGLQHPPRTNWSWRAMRYNFSHHLWDETSQRLVGFVEVGD